MKYSILLTVVLYLVRAQFYLASSGIDSIIVGKKANWTATPIDRALYTVPIPSGTMVWDGDINSLDCPTDFQVVHKWRMQCC